MEQGNSVLGRNEGPNRTCGIRRQTLADVSNTTDATDRTTKSCAGNFAELMKEYNKLRMILAKKDKSIESSNKEKQNLRNQLKMIKEQNMGLARSNSRLLASINTAKEMYTHLKHELKCDQLVHKQIKREIEEVRKLNKEIKETKAQVQTTLLPFTSQPFQAKNPSTCVTRKRETAKAIAVIAEEDETKLEEEEEEEEEEQIIHNSPPRVEFSTALHGPRGSENQGEFYSVVRGPRQKLINQGGECSSVVRGPHQGSVNMTARRRSIDRPLRKAVEKVSSYKETPLNSKLRRPF